MLRAIIWSPQASALIQAKAIIINTSLKRTVFNLSKLNNITEKKINLKRNDIKKVKDSKSL